MATPEFQVHKKTPLLDGMILSRTKKMFVENKPIGLKLTH